MIDRERKVEKQMMVLEEKMGKDRKAAVFFITIDYVWSTRADCAVLLGRLF